MPHYLRAIFLALLLILNITPSHANASQGFSISEQKVDHQAGFAGRPLADNRQWFHGKVADADTGLQYFDARYYNPLLGRFMGVDPVGFPEDYIHSFNKPRKSIRPNSVIPAKAGIHTR